MNNNNIHSVVNANKDITFQCYNKDTNENIIIFHDSYNKQYIYLKASPKKCYVVQAHSLKFLATYFTFPEWCMPHLNDDVPELYNYYNSKIVVSIDLNDMIVKLSNDGNMPDKACDDGNFINFKYLLSLYNDNKLVKISDILAHYDIPNSSILLTEQVKSDKTFLFTDILDTSSEWINAKKDFITFNNTIFVYRNVYAKLLMVT